MQIHFHPQVNYKLLLTVEGLLELLRISVFVSFFHLGKLINLEMVNPGSFLWSHVTDYELLLAVEGLWELLRISVFLSLAS